MTGTTGRCPGCKASVSIDCETMKQQSTLQIANPISLVDDSDDQSLGVIRDLLTPREIEILGVASMTSNQRRTLHDLALRMFGLGQHIISEIVTVKFDGRLVVLEDGSRWEVASSDSYVADSWLPGDKVIVIDNEMFRLDDSEKVDVEEHDL